MKKRAPRAGAAVLGFRHPFPREALWVLRPRMTCPAAAGARRIRRSARRPRALLLGGFVDGLAVVAIVGVATLLVLRLFGVAPFDTAIRGGEALSPWWIALIAAPVAAALLRVRRGEPSLRDIAVHLDRRLGLDGLLLSGTEQDASAWTSRLTSGVADVGPALPQPRWRRLLARAALPLAALAAVLALPPPSAGAALGLHP